MAERNLHGAAISTAPWHQQTSAPITKISGEQDLENTYGLASAANIVDDYRSFAASYDAGFVQEMGYHYYPKAIADTYQKHATADDAPVADIGCGTGIVVAELNLAPDQIDGMDISPEMLVLAQEKGLYRRLYEVDLTGDISAIDSAYGAVVSAGTFTFGHLGPAPLRGCCASPDPGHFSSSA